MGLFYFDMDFDVWMDVRFWVLGVLWWRLDFSWDWKCWCGWIWVVCIGYVGLGGSWVVVWCIFVFVWYGGKFWLVWSWYFGLYVFVVLWVCVDMWFFFWGCWVRIWDFWLIRCNSWWCCCCNLWLGVWILGWRFLWMFGWFVWCFRWVFFWWIFML